MPRKIAQQFLLLAAGLVMCLEPSHAAPMTAPTNISLLIVDQERVLRESIAGQDMAAQGQVLRDQIQQEVTQEQNAIMTAAKEIEQNAKVYSPAQREQKIKEVETRRQAYPGFEQKKSQVFQVSISRASNQIANALKPILQQLIDERKATVVLDRQVVMYAAPGLDVTDEAIKRLNNVVRAVKVERVDFQPPGQRPPSAPGKPPMGIAKPN
jgi:outer membrane protein